METTTTQTILDEIVLHKREEVAYLKRSVPLRRVLDQVEQAPTSRDFRAALQASGVSLIAEVKRASPSKGVLRDDLDPAQCAVIYEKSGAAAVSVLTEQHYFQGSLADLYAVRQAVGIPVLRKDFIFDPYQIYEARAAGADAVLLITAILTDDTLNALYHLIVQLGMAALVEVHNARELERALMVTPSIIGINNRNLKTFDVSLNTTAYLLTLLPHGVVTVAESGIHTAQDVVYLRQLGVNAMLVGEAIVTAPDMGLKVRELSAVSVMRVPDDKD
ncbi:MAG: indole-3-glycerol phosphate synthase TrpC [Anaerolineales bacterium]|nr:MAG: indole-3-glycerol phosphate synthase TrpC [Anaerolineales bacterium]